MTIVVTVTAALIDALMTGKGRKAKDLRKAKLRKLFQKIVENNTTGRPDEKKTITEMAQKYLSSSHTWTEARNAVKQLDMVTYLIAHDMERLDIIEHMECGDCADYFDTSSMSAEIDYLNKVAEGLIDACNHYENTTDADFRNALLAGERAYGGSPDGSFRYCTRNHEWIVTDNQSALKAISEYLFDTAMVLVLADEDLTTTTNSTKGNTMTNTAIKFDINKESKPIVDAVLSSLGMSSYDEVKAHIDEMTHEINSAGNKPAGVTLNYNFEHKVAANSGLALPSGKFTMEKAKDVFDIPKSAASQFDFDVPVWTWDGVHPNVPVADPDYQFHPTTLLQVLWSIIGNKKSWLYGDTGTGKSSLIDQVAARLNYPVVRVNFDSEITRMDLIGSKEIRTDDKGNTVTQFEDGVLPQAVGQACILLCDEIDFVRPDVAYVLQRVLEDGGSLMLTEDAGRLVNPHAMFRIFATANTKGKGDDTGRYMGARPQSEAVRDRFNVWIAVDYLSVGQLTSLLLAKVPAIKDHVDRLAKYAKEHWVAFQQGDLNQPLSPRSLVTVAETYTFLSGVVPKDMAFRQALDFTILNRCDSTDAQVISGLIQRVTK